ncbi:MAG: HAMP domain-containing histidine kinase [Bacteroidetes bacterium]|nr:HAMP domain-containing histidine kinase [Bacteroidota bacterium]
MRFFLVACLVIPVLVVQTKEKALLICALTVSAFFLFFLDPIFNFMDVGYEDLVGDGKQYFFTANFFSITSYIFILFCFLFEKNLSDKAQSENEILISFLNKANKEIAYRNTEIKSQSGELMARQDQLIQANALIEKQKERLLVIQSDLQSELVERNKELTNANDELIKYNHELQQFSYTISHNLRGPLARLLGLTNLMEKDLADLTGAQLELVKMVAQSAKELDEVIRDLGKIIDIRNDIFRIREKVFFQEEWSNLLRSLSTFVQPDMHIETDFRQAPMVFTVRPILTSVLYNLASNAIKYRSPDRALILKIKTARSDDGAVLEVSDNGLGIDLNQNDRNVFGLYKRFHTHTDGKGLGLYLVKLQIESLGGSVEVQSELNVGSTFKVSFKEPTRVEGQVVYESDFASVIYNARINCTTVRWKGQVSSKEYRFTFMKCVDIVRTYRTPFWISDLSDRGSINPEDQQWVISTMMPEAMRYGLRKIATVYRDNQYNKEYFGRLEKIAAGYGVEIKFFADNGQAVEWIESFIETPVL